MPCANDAAITAFSVPVTLACQEVYRRHETIEQPKWPLTTAYIGAKALKCQEVCRHVAPLDHIPTRRGDGQTSHSSK